MTSLNFEVSEFQGYLFSTKLIDSDPRQNSAKQFFPSKFIINFTKIRSYPAKLEQIKDFYKESSHNILNEYNKTDDSKMRRKIVHILSSLCVLDLKEELQQFKNIIFSQNFVPDGHVSVDDFVPDIVGNLISAYQLTDDKSFLLKAKEYADFIMPFTTECHFFTINNDNGNPKGEPCHHSKIKPKYSVFPCEFITLSILLDDPKYMQHTMRKFKKVLRDYSKELGWKQQYDYLDKLVKGYHLIGDSGQHFMNLYLKYMNDVRPARSPASFVDQYRNNFVAGTIMMGIVKINEKMIEDRNLSRYIMKQIVENLDKPGYGDSEAYFNALISLFALYRLEPSQEYRDLAWKSFEKIKSMTADEFTLKALMFIYLIHSDSNFFSLDDYIFNEHGVPFKIIKEIDMKKWGPFIEYRGYTADDLEKRYSDLADLSKYF